MTTRACDCCTGSNAETPRAIENPPGLSAIAYRVGRHGTFKESMLARLSSGDFPALARLRTRADTDFSIALCDATALMLDVLTFYQERLANEAFMRTAHERRSISELARLIGYQLAPGAAANVHIAFMLAEAPGQPVKPLNRSRYRLARRFRVNRVPTRSRRHSKPSRAFMRGRNGTLSRCSRPPLLAPGPDATSCG